MTEAPLKITFLGSGTSSGVPMIACKCAVCTSTDPKDKRLRSSIMVQSATTTIVVDTTPDFRYQMLRANVDKLDAVIYTHPHKDHLGGLDDVRPFNFFLKKPIHLYANGMTQEVIVREFAYAFTDFKYPGVPDLKLHTINNTKPFTIGDITITPILVWHLKMRVLGFRFGDFTYITDANQIDEEEKEKIKGSKILVLNALRKEKHVSHFSLQEAIDLAQELKVEQAYFTHISHQLGKHADVMAELPPGIALSYDGLEIHTR